MAATQEAPYHEPLGALAPPNLLQILWNRKALIILGVVVGVVGGALYFAQRQPVYETTAQVLVERKLPEVPVPASDPYGLVEDYLATQIDILKSPRIVVKAVRENNLGTLRSFNKMSESAIVGNIRGALKVTRDAQANGSGGASTLNLLYRGSDPDDCKTILDAIIVSYQQFLSGRSHDKDQVTTEKLVDTIKMLEPKLERLREEQRKLLIEGPIRVGKDGVTVQEEKLIAVQARVTGLSIRAQELEARIQMIEAEINRGFDPTVLIEATENKPVGGAAAPGTRMASEADIDVQLMPQIVVLRDLEHTHGPNHPEVRSLRQKIDSAREILKSASSGSRLNFVTPTSDQEVLSSAAATLGLLATPMQQGPLLASNGLFTARSLKWEVLHYLQMIRAQLRETRMTEQALNDLAAAAAKEVHGMAGFRSEDARLNEEGNRLKGYIDTLSKLLNDRSTLGSSGGYMATALAEPERGYQIEPKPTPIFTVAVLLGLGAGVVLAWLAEATDKSFRTPDEVRRRLGLPVVGHVPQIKPEAEAMRQHEAGALLLDPSICAFYQSKSIEAEAFRGIRTTLYFSAQQDDRKIIQVTSPNMGDGKTTLATNLAVSMAQSGKKILLIDADFRRPRLHRMFGLRARTGLATVIQDDSDLTEAIQTTQVPNLSILPCGPRPNHPAELLTSPRFKQVLETLRDKFDLILIDTPPLLAVSDPSVVASQVDSVLLTIRVSKNGRPGAERARDILATMEANVLGVVVNGVGTRGQEGYGASHYGYQYQYHYAYEPTDNRSYYQDAETDSQVHKNGETANGFDSNGTHANPVDPDAVDLTRPHKHEPSRPRERHSSSRRKRSDRAGVVGGLARWLRSTLWH